MHKINYCFLCSIYKAFVLHYGGSSDIMGRGGLTREKTFMDNMETAKAAIKKAVYGMKLSIDSKKTGQFN
jgi:hypothetical protein